jgi:cyclopropane fatty-acyl-phospholipid synthase-like methyltransferase
MRTFILFLINNILINRLLIWLHLDSFIKRFGNDWSRNKIDVSKSMQENVGFSHTHEVDLAISKIHQYIKDVEAQHLKVGDKVLDIGCGVGLYLQDFLDKELYGTDLNKDFLDVCKSQLPLSHLHLGDYLSINFSKQYFDFIYSISVIEYIPPSKIQFFFDKIVEELKPNGIIAIQYPHALSLNDKWYSDLSYISYLPEKIEKCLNQKFDLLMHEHSFDKRSVKGIDKVNYGKNRQRNFCNGMILVARKKV